MTNAAGKKSETALYRPYGEQSEQVWTALLNEAKGFIGERYDADAGLQYLNARYYDPRLGMFTQPDWWEVMKAGVGTNRYAYSFNDPVNGKDPSGHTTYVEPNKKTKRPDDYTVKEVVLDGKNGILVMDKKLPKEKWRKIGETRFEDAFISPDTKKAVGIVYEGLSFDKRFAALAKMAKVMDPASLALASLSGQLMDVKATTTGYGSYSGTLLNRKYMTLREIGNTLAGYNAKQAGKPFSEFQRVAGALQVGGWRAALKSEVFGTTYGEPPNYGEKDYQRIRSEYGYDLSAQAVEGWLP